MKNIVMFVVIIWFVLGVSAADDRGFFNTHVPRTCAFVGSAALTVIAGPVNYTGHHPHAYC